jgi:lipopolysaccharide transport system permease protein
MFGKVYFPRLIMPLSIILSSLVRFLAQLLLMLVLIIYYVSTGVDINIGVSIILFPFLILLTGVFSLGIGLIVTSVTTKYRDVAMLLSFAIQLFVYACPVVYPLSALPNKWQKILSLNPLTTIIEGVRTTLLGQGELNYFYLIYSLVICIVILLIGVIVFNKQEKSFIDTI